MPAASIVSASRPTKKRKATSPPNTETKKLSPLAGLPQNHYAPPHLSDMSPAEVAAWRKEQRRERNRKSAAASRQQTKTRIAELEGDVLKYKSQYEEMKKKMEGMERQIALLTELNAKKTVAADPTPSTVTVTTIDYPNSPSTCHANYTVDETHPALVDIPCLTIPTDIFDASPPVSNPDYDSFLTSLFTPDCPPNQVTSHPTTFDTTSSFSDDTSFISPAMFSEEHLTPISRQA